MTPPKVVKSPVKLTFKSDIYRVPRDKDKARMVPISVKVDQRLAFLLEKVWAHGKHKLPWDTPSDFYRWALWNGAEQVSRVINDKSLDDDAEKFKLVQASVLQWELDEGVNDVLLHTEKVVEKMEREGDQVDIPHRLQPVLKAIRGMSGYRGRKMLKEFTRRYGRYLDRYKIDLRPSRAQQE